MYNFGAGRKRKEYGYPYNTYKEWSNKESPYKARNSTTSMFMSERNVGFIASQVYDFAFQNNFQFPRAAQSFDAITNEVRDSMARWAKKVKLDQWKPAYEYDTASNLDFANNKFMDQNKYLYQQGATQNDINVFRGSARFASYDAQGNPHVVEKKFKDLMPEDIRNLDVWRPVHIGRNNADFRYNNQIPPWQRTMNIRPYDYQQEGLAMLDPDRASVEQFQRGFNMKKINEGNFWNR